MSRGRSSALVLAAVAAGGVALGGCGGSSASYRESASQTAQAELSQAQTALLALRSWLTGDLTGAAAVVIVRDADASCDGTVSAFAAQDPPPGGLALRPRVLQALQEVAGDVSDARVAVTGGDRGGAARAEEALSTSAAALDKLGVTLR